MYSSLQKIFVLLYKRCCIKGLFILLVAKEFAGFDFYSRILFLFFKLKHNNTFCRKTRNNFSIKKSWNCVALIFVYAYLFLCLFLRDILCMFVIVCMWISMYLFCARKLFCQCHLCHHYIHVYMHVLMFIHKYRYINNFTNIQDIYTFKI